MRKKVIQTFLLGFGLIGAVAVAWRLVSRLRPFPCPPWLGWLLENPLTRGMNANLLIRRAGLKPGMRILDAGCGPGRVTVPAAEAVGEKGEVIALDIQPAMLDLTRKRVKAARMENVRYMLSALGENMLPENRFDRAFLVTVMGEIPDKLAAMQEIAASLKPGGVLSITEILLDPHYQSLKAIRLLAHRVGLIESAVYGNRFTYTVNLRKPLSEAVHA
ncbi:MAG: methyltransferase domain-containing protein [Leptolinea sp.]|jgi:ubiquinone/menaquinone biosynthesis C-methylase UbiE|nr:methyltransferase domain-containing protein [Leptolinea sp.]